MVGTFPHRSFQTLAKKYGPIMYLELGSRPVIVVSSPEMGERLLRNHDVLSASRPVSDVSHDLSYGLKGFTFTPYGAYWQNVRKLCVMEVLSATKIRTFEWLRKEEIGKLVSSLRDSSNISEAVDIGESVGGVLEELIYRMLYGSPKRDLALRPVILETLRLSGTLNISDYLTFLAPFDPQGLKRRIKKLMVIIDDVLEKIISMHEDESKSEERTHRDIVDVLLSIMKNNNEHHPSNGPLNEIKKENIKAILFDLVVPAIDSATNLVKWSLASLIKKPTKNEEITR
ncbi:cytochrome P450 CYP736A12-like [Silene latifolia]|uniref:cytochrome P450 CYP736A12-like n=1 Tax=Silene latifolia TaxID=37657 RepID=UPI003D787439